MFQTIKKPRQKKSKVTPVAEPVTVPPVAPEPIDRWKQRKPLTTTEPSEFGDEWEDVGVYTVDADWLGYTWPKNRVPVLARPGMVASCHDVSFTDGIIETMTEEFVIVRFPNGQRWPFRWGEISLHDVRPDPAYLPPPLTGAISLSQLDAAVKAIAVERFGQDALKHRPRVFVGLEGDGSQGARQSGDIAVVEVSDELAELREGGRK